MNKIVIIMDLLEIWATWIFDRYQRVKKSLTYTLHFLFTQPCNASDGNYFLSSGKQTFVFTEAVKNFLRAVPDPDLEITGTRSSRLLDKGWGEGRSPKNFFSGLWASVWSENATAEGSDLFLER